MEKNRIEAFTDGVMAIIITIMVLELDIPKYPNLNSYYEMWPVFSSYAVSFLFVGLNWATHHHLFHNVKTINNKVLWLNMLNLFVLSLVPFATATMGENSFQQITVTIYAILLTLSVLIYFALVYQLQKHHGINSDFARSFRGQRKSYISLVMNIVAIIVSIAGLPKTAFIILFVTSLAWFLPNHKIENNIVKISS